MINFSRINIMDSLKSLIKPKNSLLQRQLYSKIFKDAFTELSSYENYHDLRNDMEFLIVAVNIIELLVDLQKKLFKNLKVDKKELVINLFDTLFTFSEQEKKELGERVEFLFDNGHIKKVSTSRLLKKRMSKAISDFSLL